MSAADQPTAIVQHPPKRITVWLTVPDARGHNKVVAECVMQDDAKPVWVTKDASTEMHLTRALTALKGAA
jgi:hypothetical protein